MFERFTKAAIKVVMVAQEESRRLGHNFVGTEQLLLGIIGEGKSHAATALEHCGVDRKFARAEVERIIGRGSGFVAVEIPFTPRAKRVLEVSDTHARKLGHKQIEPEHLLMGILAVEGGVANRIIEKLSSIERVRSELEKCMGQAAGTATAEYVPTAPPPVCQWCGEDIQAQAVVCKTCSKPVFDHAKRCSQCAEIIFKDALSCRFCGFKSPENPSNSV